MFQIGVPQRSILASFFIVPSVVISDFQVLGPLRAPFLKEIKWSNNLIFNVSDDDSGILCTASHQK